MQPFYVLGAGGIGCAVGYALRQAGARVIFVDADPAKVAWGQRYGVHVAGRPPLAAEFLSFEDWQPHDDDMLLLCTKCYDNAAVLGRLPRRVTLIPIQNGFDPALDGRGDSLEGIASFVSECNPGQTQTRITRAGKLHLGPRGRATVLDAARRMVELLQRTRLFRVVVVSDILPFKYTKLMYNAAISPLASAAGIDNGELLSFEPARRLFFALLQENYAILRGAGVPLGQIGPFRPATVAWILRHVTVSRVLAWAFTPSLRHTYCSMSRDLPAGRTEIDYYNGRLIELAGNRPCPLNRRLYELVKRMERTQLRPNMGILTELLSERIAA